MGSAAISSERGRVYRVDKFKVPPLAREEFLGKVHETHALLRTLPGFEGDFLLEQSSGPGEFNVVTIAIWKDEASIVQAKAAVEAEREKTGFSPQELLVRLGIEADLANYREMA